MVTRRTFMKSLGLSALAPAALSALSADETPRSPALEAKTLRLVQYCDPQLGFGEEGFGPSLDRFHKAIDLINDPATVEKAKAELDKKMGGEKYVCPIPAGTKPRGISKH